MEELVRYEPHLVVGIMGGSAGTTRDAFQLLHDAQKYGAKAALFGRKINQAENQLAFVQFLRLITDGVLGPEDATKAYHSVLRKLGIPPRRSLDDDLKLTPTMMSYGGSTAAVTVPAMPQAQAPASSEAKAKSGCGCGCKGSGDSSTPACPASAPTPAPVAVPAPKRPLVTESASIRSLASGSASARYEVPPDFT